MAGSAPSLASTWSWFVKTTRSGARAADGSLPAEVWTRGGVCPTLNTGDNTGESRATILMQAGAVEGVRRLTPLECERLQGFPDGWTDVPGATDSGRYKQCGNAVTVNVFDWVLGRIVAVDEAARDD